MESRACTKYLKLVKKSLIKGLKIIKIVKEQHSGVWQSYQRKSKQGNGVQHWEQQAVVLRWHYKIGGQPGIAPTPKLKMGD